MANVKLSALPVITNPGLTDRIAGTQVAGPTDVEYTIANMLKAGLVKSVADANGWVKRDYGGIWQTYEQVFTVTSLAVAGNGNSSITSGTALPVGITNMSQLRWSCSQATSFAGRIFASIDNGGSSTATTLSLIAGNLTTGSITFSGQIYVYAITT